MEEPNEFEKDDDLLVQDKFHLLQFLPSEIWKHVTAKFPKPHLHTSVENMSNSSTFYRKLLNGERTEFIFGKVLNILVNETPHLHLGDVLNFRQVCKSWNQQIDKMFTNTNFKLYHNREINNFSSYNNVAKFLTQFEHTHPKISKRSPFIGGKVILTVNDGYVFRGPNIVELNTLKFNGISTFMERYGRHIKNISIIYQLNNYQIIKSVLEKLTSWLIEMKNLTKFSITNEMLYSEGPHEAESNQQYLFTSFPKLDKLTELHMDAWFPENLGLNIIKNNNHITKLHVEKSWSSRINHNYKLLGSLSFQNLIYLDINMGSIGKLENLEKIDIPKLFTLTIIAERGHNFNEQPKWSELFSAIETKFGNTLERLSVEMESSDSQMLDDAKEFQLNLPKLKEIRLLVKAKSASLNFLLPMKDKLANICVMMIRGSSVYEEDDFINKFNLQVTRAANAAMFKFLHFDISFDDIKSRLNYLRVRNGVERITISDRIFLR